MKIKDGYLLRKIADTNIVVPVAERVIDFKGMILLNDVSACIWEFLSEDREYADIIDHVVSIYDVGRDTAGRDLDVFINQMETGGVLIK